MPAAIRPSNWKRIERDVKLRANFRCECGTFWHCGDRHNGRCPNIEGNRYAHNKRVVGLRVVQVGAQDDWRPTKLIALCLPCFTLWEQHHQSASEATESEQDGLFDQLHS